MSIRFTVYFGLLLPFFCAVDVAIAQDRWQQAVKYEMDIQFDHVKHQFKGKQKLTLTNNSPDTLTRVYYHLYFNAFQPGSMMDVRSRTIEDPDPRVRDRIFSLKPEEIGYQRILSLNQNGKAVKAIRVFDSIAEIELERPILPKSKTVFDMEFEAQVPVQIRRSGRYNREGVAYSMAQWYPKMSQYDRHGWHPNPYIGREFYGIFGDFDVRISIDSSFTVAATGTLSNAQEIGKGYQDHKKPVKRAAGTSLTWNFKASNVHDFVWAADPEYVHVIKQTKNGPLLRFFYKPSKETANWEKLPDITERIFDLMNTNFGRYPYDQYSVIQGGDGGMEYPMATLITGHRSLESLVGVTAHEVIHSWYQGVLATNESWFSWMDEGFTSFAETWVVAKLNDGGSLNPWSGSYTSYFNLVKAGKTEPLTTHADHFNTNRGFSVSSYSRGALVLSQLYYMMGEDLFFKAMRRYYNTWKFRHPDMHDFISIMEKESGLVLDWFFDQWVGTNNVIDYAIRGAQADGDKTKLTLERKGGMPMPLLVRVDKKDGTSQDIRIPLDLMRHTLSNTPWKDAKLDPWPWTHPFYVLKLDIPTAEIAQITIDPAQFIADVDRSNNVWIVVREEDAEASKTFVPKGN
jgi:hypothetical protein